MYHHCIACTRSLGANEQLEAFPVGRRIAFDAARGRLWAVCPHCGRWNLAPIEERWEPVEAAERLYRDATQRVQRENIGLARLGDGTRLIRIGDALAGELAAWRYGQQLRTRRREYLLVGAGSVATAGVIIAGSPLIAAATPMMAISAGLQLFSVARQAMYSRRVVARLDGGETPTGTATALRREDLRRARVELDGGDVVLRFDNASRLGRAWGERALLRGERARRTLARSMVDYNQRGGTAQHVADALSAIEAAGGADAFVRHAASMNPMLARPTGMMLTGEGYSVRQVAGTFRNQKLPVTRRRDLFDHGTGLDRIRSLALEMALHEEDERRALEGELRLLERAWEEAESIAAIADGELTPLVEGWRGRR